MNSPNVNPKLTIDQFNVSEECCRTLKGLGFEEVGEVAEWLARIRIDPGQMGLVRNLGERNMKEIIAQLRLLELWRFED